MLGVFKSDKDKSLNDPLITAEEGRAGQGKAKESSTVDYSVSSSPADTGDPTNGQGLTDGQVLSLRAEWGENKLPENKKSKLYLLLLAFTSPMACLIWVAVLIELIIGLIKAGEGKPQRACAPDEPAPGRSATNTCEPRLGQASRAARAPPRTWSTSACCSRSRS